MKSFTTYKVSSEHDGLTVETYLKQILQYSGRRIQKLTRKKGLFLNGKPAYLKGKVKLDDTLRILVLEDASYGVQPEQGAIDILYEDESMIVLNKPAYQLVHPTGRTTTGTLANYLAYHLQERGTVCTIRPIHRLDRETSGCVIFAKDSRSQFMLEQQLKARILKRTYHALVKGIVDPPSGTIDVSIGPHPSSPNRRIVDQSGEQAITHYITLQNFSDTSLLELNLETGRTHQIRIHLAYIGHSILGDKMYGVHSPLIARQALHAASVSFHHLKDERELIVHAPIPADVIKVIDNLS